jgi:hypothetical protein
MPRSLHGWSGTGGDLRPAETSAGPVWSCPRDVNRMGDSSEDDGSSGRWGTPVRMGGQYPTHAPEVSHR